MAIPRIERRWASRAPTSAIETLWPWAMRSLRLLTTRRLSFKDIASPIESSSCRTPMVIKAKGQGERGKGQDGLCSPLAPHPSPLPLQRALERLADVRFVPVTHLHVVVVRQLDAALEPGLHFLHVVLHAAERFDREILGDDLAVANEADLAAALDVPVGDEAAGDVAELGHLEHLPHFHMAVQLLADFRLEQAGERLLQVVEDLVDDAVQPDLDAPLLGHRAGGFVGNHVEPDDDRV